MGPNTLWGNLTHGGIGPPNGIDYPMRETLLGQWATPLSASTETNTELVGGAKWAGPVHVSPERPHWAQLVKTPNQTEEGKKPPGL